MKSYEPFFLRFAHRFFIASDSRFLPAGVRRWWLFFEAVWCEAAVKRYRLLSECLDATHSVVVPTPCAAHLIA
jgi:hypothetical protein